MLCGSITQAVGRHSAPKTKMTLETNTYAICTLCVTTLRNDTDKIRSDHNAIAGPHCAVPSVLNSEMKTQRRKLTLGMLAGISGTVSWRVQAQQTKPEPFAPPPGTRDNIVALVRNFQGPIRKFQDIKPLTGMKVQGLEDQPDMLPLIDTFVGDLDIRYAFDADSGYRYLSERDLKTLKLTRDQLLALAVANQRRLYPKSSVERPTSFVGMFANSGELEPSKMLDFDFWEKEKSRPLYSGGEIVCAVPARDVCWFTSLKPADNVRNLRANTERVHKEAGERAISKLLYLWRNKRWEVLEA